MRVREERPAGRGGGRRRPAAAVWIAAAAAAVFVAGCGGRGAGPSLRSEPGLVAVDPATLFDPNAPQDPVVSYRLRLATEPSNPALYNNLGNLYVLRNWMDEAVDAYKEAIDLDPRSPVAWNNLGTAYRKMGRTGAAMSAYRKAVRLDERYALAWYNIGVIFDERGDYDRAIEMYMKAASYRPQILTPEDNPQVISNRHIVAVRLRRYLEEEGNLALPLESMPE